MADEVVLLGFWLSPFGMRIRIALDEKGIKYEHKEENLQYKTPLLLKMNPVHAKVPVLIHNGKPICESLVIIQYLDEVWKDTCPLLPSDPYLRAQARFWADFIDKKIFYCGRETWMSKGEDNEAAKELIESLKVLEGELGEKPYLGGEQFGYVDLCLIPFCTWFYSSETFGNFSMNAECPKLIAWAQRCLQKEIVSNSLPFQLRVHQSFGQMRRNFGNE